MRYPDDGNPFNAGWNAALDEAIERIKKLPATTSDGVIALIAKVDVLKLLRTHGQSARNDNAT